jgi:hypothetical protein
MLRDIRGVGSGVRRLRGARAPSWLRPDAVGLLVAVLVLGGGTAAGLAAAGVIESEPAPNPGSHPTPPPPTADLHPRLVAQRVERLRGLEFKHVPPVRVLAKRRFEMAIRDIGQREKEQAAHRGQAKHFRREGQAGQYFLKLAAVVPPEFEFENAQQELGLEVLGLYDSGSQRILLPQELVAQGPDVAQGYLAHELTHALDDQHFGVDLPEDADPYADSTAAFEALGEGDASYVQLLYGRRYGPSTLNARQQIRREAAGLAVPLTPPLVQESLFPYVDGAKFVAALHERGGSDLVDLAWQDSPPQTTQQVLHPADYFAGVVPGPVSAPPPNALGPGWRSVASGSVTEEDTRVLMTVGLREAVSKRIADGWDGARFEVWRRRGAPACVAACREDTAGVVVWRWQSPKAAALFAGGLHDYALLGFLAERAGPLLWKVDDGYMAALPLARSSAIAFAPDPKQARELAKTAALLAE